MWAPIILGILQFLGPILEAAFKEWLERKLKEVAPTDAGPTYNVTTNQVELLKRVHDSLWVWQFGKRRAVQQCIQAVLHGRDTTSVIGA